MPAEPGPGKPVASRGEGRVGGGEGAEGGVKVGHKSLEVVTVREVHGHRWRTPLQQLPRLSR
jgi:hypothetical protein